MKDLKDILCYSTVAGELPRLVANSVPMCFVSWEDWNDLVKEYEEIKFILEGLQK